MTVEDQNQRLHDRNAELEKLVQELKQELAEEREKNAHQRFSLQPDEPNRSAQPALTGVITKVDLICHFSPDYKVTFVNEAYCRYFNQTYESLIGQSLQALTSSPEETQEWLPQSEEALTQDNLLRSREGRHLLSNGEIRWLQWIDQAIFAAQGDLVEIQSVGRDITERKQAEERLQQTIAELGARLEEQSAKVSMAIAQLETEVLQRQQYQSSLEVNNALYQSVVNTLQTGILIIGIDGKIRTCNASAERIFNTSAAELLRRDVFHPRFKTIHENGSPCSVDEFPVSISLRTGAPCSDIVLGICWTEQEITWVTVNTQPLFHPGQSQPYAVVASVADITVRKRVEAELTQLLVREQAARAQAELAWKSRLNLLESVVVNANDAIMVTEAEPIRYPGPRIVYVNQAFTRLTGYSAEEAIGKSPRFLQGSKTDPATLGQIRAALENHQPYLAELINYRKDGSELWLEMSIFPIPDAEGCYTHWIAIQRDITQRKRAEEELRHQHLRSQLYADIALKIRQSLRLEEILQTTVTEIRNLLQVDRVLICRFLPDRQGLVSTESVAADWIAMLGQTFPAAVFEQQYESYQSGTPEAIEDVEQAEISPYRANSLRQLEIRAKVVIPIILNQSPWGLLVAHQRTVPRQWADFEIELLMQLANQVGIALAQCQLWEALQESEERFRMMANSAPVLLWTVNLEQEYTFFNPGWLKVLGRSPEESMGQNWIESIHPEDVPQYLQTHRAAFETQQAYKMEYRLRQATGEYNWILEHGIPKLAPDGRFAGFIGSCIDISDRKQAEVEIQCALEKAEELSALKSRFISCASHEFRTPLSTILSSADLLEFYLATWSRERQQEHIARIQNAAVYMTSLLDDVLVIEQTDAGHVRFEPKPLDLLQFCRNLIHDFQLQHPDRTISLQALPENAIGLSTSRGSARIDEKLLRQILSNLLSNALKYSSTDTSVQITVTGSNHNAVFQVQDQGIGIPDADQLHLFEPFHRATNVGTTAGTGLGLAIVKRAVEVHKGQVALTSKVGVGTTVTVTLPLYTF